MENFKRKIYLIIIVMSLLAITSSLTLSKPLSKYRASNGNLYQPHSIVTLRLDKNICWDVEIVKLKAVRGRVIIYFNYDGMYIKMDIESALTIGFPVGEFSDVKIVKDCKYEI